MTSQQTPPREDRYFVDLNEDEIEILPETIDTPESPLSEADLASFSLKTKPLRFLRPLFYSIIALVGFYSVWEVLDFVDRLMQWHWLAGVAFSTTAIISLLLLLKVLYTVRRHQLELETVSDSRSLAQLYIEEQTFGQSAALLTKLQQLYEDKPQAMILKSALESLPDYNNDAETVRHLSEHFLTRLDDMVLAKITRYSQQTAVMVALSPLAIADLFLALWRSLKMIDEIGRIYGLRPSWVGRIRLMRMLLNNMALAGASEMLSDYVADFTTASLTRVVSSRMAQGLGVGLYTARIGIQTMQLCRPLPFEKHSKPSVKKLVLQISSHLKERIE